ncbi:MAG: hypothetical protein GKS03_02000 [Alphaproteobacteria bacterium]|nr:hypothetical protein [Alphaproteobacteria bacterium]
MSEEKASILMMKAAGEVRRAAELDKKRAIELTSVADYLESMIFEDELDKGRRQTIPKRLNRSNPRSVRSRNLSPLSKFA